MIKLSFSFSQTSQVSTKKDALTGISSNDNEQNKIANLLDDLVENVIRKERFRHKHETTATMYRCFDPSAIVVAHTYGEMYRIVEEYRNQSKSHFFMSSYKISGTIEDFEKSEVDLHGVFSLLKENCKNSIKQNTIAMTKVADHTFVL